MEVRIVYAAKAGGALDRFLTLCRRMAEAVGEPPPLPTHMSPVNPSEPHEQGPIPTGLTGASNRQG